MYSLRLSIRSIVEARKLIRKVSESFIDLKLVCFLFLYEATQKYLDKSNLRFCHFYG